VLFQARKGKIHKPSCYHVLFQARKGKIHKPSCYHVLLLFQARKSKGISNTYVAERLSRKFPHTMLLRCHPTPESAELGQWLENEGPLAHLVMKLQDKVFTTDTTQQNQLSLSAITDDSQYPHKVVIQTDLWNRLKHCLEQASGKEASVKQASVKEAQQLTFMDEAHPLQCLALAHWMELMNSAEYRTAVSTC
jgi:hypothetical protein